MARMKKINELKKKQTTVTLPASLHNFVTNDGDLVMSKLLQSAIADKVLGSVSMGLRDEFSKVYGEDENYCARYKLSSISDEFIRMARWMLESEIVSLSIIDDTRIALNVIWNIPGTATQVLIDFNKLAFQHIVYDAVLNVPVATQTTYSVKEDAQEELEYLSGVNKFKYLTLMTWMNISWEGK